MGDLKSQGIEAIAGNADDPRVQNAANLAGARWLISAIPNPFEASSLIEAGRSVNPDLIIVARAHAEAEVEHLKNYGADYIILGELETAKEMIRCLELHGRIVNANNSDFRGRSSSRQRGARPR
jgi:CPA2 family monovalent cation:H+ antiporter-2